MVDASLLKNYEELGNRIIIDAMNEYTQALRLRNRPNISDDRKKEAEYVIKSCKKFFRSGFYDSLCAIDCEVLESIAERKARENCNRYYGASSGKGRIATL